MSFINSDFTEENIIKIVKEILIIDNNDETKISFDKIMPIHDEGEYGGFRIF